MSVAASELSRIEDLRRLQILDTPPEEEFELITELAAQLFGVPIALVSLVDETRQWFKSNFGLDARETNREHAFCAKAIAGDEDVFVVGDATADDRFKDNPLVTGGPKIRFYAGAPLTSKNGSKLGTLCVIDRAPRDFSKRDRSLLLSLTRLVNARLENRLRGRYDFAPEKNHRRLLDTLAGFSAGIADELANTSTISLGHLQFLRQNLNTDGENRRRVDTLQRTNDRLVKLGRHLSRLGSHLKTDRAAVNASQLLKSCYARISAMLPTTVAYSVTEGRPLTVLSQEKDLADCICTMVWFTADRCMNGGRVEVTLTDANISDGSADKTGQGGSSSGRSGCIRVSGTMKVPGADLSSLVTADGRYDRELAELYAMSSRCGGHLFIDHGENGDFSISLYLSRTETQSETPPETLDETADTPVEPDTGLAGRVAVVADSDAAARQKTADALKAFGLTVFEADTADAAKQTLARRHVDILFVDPRLPESTSGLHLAATVLPMYPALRVLFQPTSDEMNFSHLREHFERCDALSKQASTGDLFRVLQSLL